MMDPHNDAAPGLTAGLGNGPPSLHLNASIDAIAPAPGSNCILVE